MKKMMKLCKTFICLVLVATLTYGCGKVEPIVCPYTDLGWETSEDELFEAKGDYVNSYKSIYEGTTYEYDGTYMDKTGRIKYMFDEDGILASVAFTYSSTDSDDLLEFYEKIYNGLEDEYGKSVYNTNEETNYGATWEMKKGKVLLSVMNTDSLKALQVAYVHPIECE